MDQNSRQMSEAMRRRGMEMPLEQLVDLSSYPIADPKSAAAGALVELCRARLAHDGVCVLEGFLRPDAAKGALAEIQGLLGQAFYCEKQHNPYLSADDPAFAVEHPRNRPQVSDLGCLADDLISEGSLLRRLYQWEKLQAFIAALLEVPRLYPYADPLGSLNVNIFQPGQQLGWHYDNADWAVTLMLQPAEAGGVYEYLPWLRGEQDENYDAAARVLDGERAGVRVLAQGVGALVLFRGRRSLHRVTPVLGVRPRLVAVLSYDTEPGVMLSEHNRMLFYGRVT